MALEAINIIGHGVTDPHIRIHEDRAYLYASHDHAVDCSKFVMKDWQVWSSDDLLNWKLESTLRPEDTYVGQPIDGCWATDAVEKDGRYYWCFSEVDKASDRHQIGLVVSERPGGPWRDLLGKPLLADRAVDTEVYDPCFFKDDDGAIYLFFGVWDYYFARMSDDMRSVAEPPRRVKVIHPEGPYGKGKTDDKVFVHKRDGLYYLSWGSYYAVSDTIGGPYTFKGCIVDPKRMEARFRERTWPHGPTQGRHGSFFEWNNQWFFAYCEMCFSGNRYFRDFWLSYVHYRENGDIEPIRINSQSVGTYDAAAGPIQAEDFFRSVRAVARERAPAGFDVVLLGPGSSVDYPNVRGADGAEMISICLKAQGSHMVLTVEATGERQRSLAQINLEWLAGNGYQTVNCPLDEPLGDSEDIRISLAGEAGAIVQIDWFQLSK